MSVIIAAFITLTLSPLSPAMQPPSINTTPSPLQASMESQVSKLDSALIDLCCQTYPMFWQGEIETDRADLGWNKASCQSEDGGEKVRRGVVRREEGVGRRRTTGGRKGEREGAFIELSA